MAAYFPTHSTLKNANWRPKGNFKCLLYLHSMREGERERELFFGRGEPKKKNIIDARIHKIPRMHNK